MLLLLLLLQLLLYLILIIIIIIVKMFNLIYGTGKELTVASSAFW